MKGNGKRNLSLCLAAVIAVTTAGYAPPFTSSASWKTNMEKALELLASPSEASRATPAEAESPGRGATPSEAEIPDGKATLSEIRFLSKVEQPEEELVQTFTVNQTYDQALGTLPEPEEKGYTYHAGWESKSFKKQFVYYDTDGKQVVIEINKDYPSRLGTLPSPEKPGYTFANGTGTYADNGNGTHYRPGTGGSWTSGIELWWYGPDGKTGTDDDYKKVDNGDTDPEPTKPEPSNPSNESKAKDNEAVTVPEISSIDSTSKPSVRNDGGTFNINPENPKDVTYIKPDGAPASNEWIGDGTNLYHVNEESKLNYSWYKEKDNEWFMLNNEPGEQLGAALRGWYSESMDKKKYFFDPDTTEMLTG